MQVCAPECVRKIQHTGCCMLCLHVWVCVRKVYVISVSPGCVTGASVIYECVSVCQGMVSEVCVSVSEGMVYAMSGFVSGMCECV